MRSTTTQRLFRRSAGLVVLGILSLCLLMVGAEAASVVTPQDEHETTTTTGPPTTNIDPPTTTTTTTNPPTTTTTTSTTTTTPTTTSTTTSPTTTTRPTTTTAPTTTISGSGPVVPTTTTTGPSTLSTSTTRAPTTTTTGAGPTTTSGGGGGNPAQPTAPPPTTVTETTLVPAEEPAEETEEDDAADDLDERAEEPVPAPSAGTLHVSPSAGPPGTDVVFRLRFDLPSSGPETVEIRFGNQRLGDGVAIDSSDVTVRRSVPDVEPGTYDLNLAVGEVVVARTSFDVTPAPSTENRIPLLVWLAPPLAAVMLWVAWLIAQTRNPTAPNDTYREALAKRTGRDIAVHDRTVDPG